MGVTTNYEIPYPERTDPVEIPTDLQALATEVDGALSGINETAGSALAAALAADDPKIYTSASLPSPSANTGLLIFVSDLGLPAYSDGTRWILLNSRDSARQVGALTDTGTGFTAVAEASCTRITDPDGKSKWDKGWRPRVRLSGLIQCSTSNIALACVGMNQINVGDNGVGASLIEDTFTQIQESAAAGVLYFARRDWTTIDDANLLGAAPSESILIFLFRTRVSGGTGTYNHLSMDVIWVFEP